MLIRMPDDEWIDHREIVRIAPYRPITTPGPDGRVPPNLYATPRLLVGTRSHEKCIAYRIDGNAVEDAAKFIAKEVNDAYRDETQRLNAVLTLREKDQKNEG